MSNKGGAYEREICKLLSNWWELGREDIYWRTSGSGGRAKTRGRKGKATYGQAGDLCATDPIGQPLIDLLTIEMKRGYSRFTIADTFDCAKNAAQQHFEAFYQQAEESREQAGSFAWLLISRRNKRDAFVFYPRYLHKQFLEEDLFTSHRRPFVELKLILRKKYKDGTKKVRYVPDGVTIVGMKLDEWLLVVKPMHIKRILARVKDA